jgi:HEAT repeat protein
MCLDRLESPGPEAVPALIRAMRDPDIRFSAIRTLGAIGPAARSAIPALLEAREDVRPYVRDIAIQTLEKIGRAP